jgi:hypothetical protein
MTERERWVVYPLLFLALGASLRDKLADRTTTKSIVCQELNVVDEEPIGGEPPRVLARIGRMEPKSGGPSSAHFIINGHVEIADDDLARSPPPHSLVRLGRTEPSPGAPSAGYAVVDGVVNARQYAYQGVLFMPALQSLPGISIPDILRALQHSGEVQKQNAPRVRPQSQPPAAAPPAGERKPATK